MLIDTHNHLYVEAFDEDREAVIERALSAGVDFFCLPAIDSQYTAPMRALQQAYPDRISLMAGLHPTHVQENWEEELEHVYKELNEGGYQAVGEIGIDLYWDKTRLAEQQQAFRAQIGWAREFALPIVIHCRDAFDEIFDILEQEKSPDVYGIFHCFTGTEQQAHRAISLGMKLGIGGVATFKNGKIDQFLNRIPLEHIVLETDAPYLSPAPFRGKRNEPAYLIQVRDRLAAIYQTETAEIDRITTENARSVFNLDVSTISD